MVSQSQNLWLEMDQVGDVTVVRFKIPWILKEGTIEAIGEALYGLAEGSSCRKIVLNFGNVKSLASTMFGKLTALHQRIEASGGRLALCSIDPGLHEVFETVKLVGLLPIYGNEQEAIQSL
jgi:stage II sporulation protein AA (anti-sigma F factor antagonist)